MIKVIKKKIINTVMYKNYRKMWKFIKPYKWAAIISLIMSVPIGALEAGVAYLLKPFMDTVLVEKSVSASYIPIVIIGITIIQSILMFVSTFLNAYVGEKISINIKSQMFKKLLNREQAFFDNSSSGDIIFNFNNNVDNACSGLLQNIKTFSVRLCSSIALIVVLFVNSWRLSILALIALFLAMVPLTNVRKKITEATKGIFASRGLILTHFNQVFHGNKIIQTYNLKKSTQKDFEKTLNDFFKLKIKITKRTGAISPVMNILVACGIAGVIWYGGSLIEQGHITPGSFVSFTVSLMMLYTPIKKIGKLFGSVQLSFIAMERMFKILEQKSAINDSSDAKVLKTVNQGIEFKDVNFRYVGNRPVLKNINLKIDMGKTFAFVGNSGGGKSTLVNLIPRFYDIQEGSITIDGNDIRDLTMNSLRDNISVVFQNNFLFSGTLRKNLLVGKPKATEAELMHAIKSACLEDFVTSLPKGLDTQIGEMGSLLSGGQKQRIAIARAFLKDAPIVILDEATSALDNKSEKVVQQAIENLIKNKTVLIIAHRLSTIRHADKIIVIDNGEIVEKGNHNYLINKENGVYRSLYKTHFVDNNNK
ncbi:MAG: ABC transporter ATP-binding protein/permease [Alphaproteobacteria bacterium]|nr:ABC transporter ATP-binding protein/permease [Alphaproteobacteria bacterium]